MRDEICLAGNFAHFCGREFPYSLGRSGIRVDKREGDGATPKGVFRLGKMLFRPDRINPAGLVNTRPIRRFDIWSDDPNDPRYNQFVPFGVPYGWSHERLWRSDHLYDLIIPVDYNLQSPIAGAGSAIFIHAWRAPRRPTEGCIAFSRHDLLWIARRVTKDTRLIVPGPIDAPDSVG